MHLKGNFNYVDFQTNMEEIAVQGSEEITYYETMFDDLKPSTS